MHIAMETIYVRTVIKHSDLFPLFSDLTSFTNTDNASMLLVPFIEWYDFASIFFSDSIPTSPFCEAFYKFLASPVHSAEYRNRILHFWQLPGKIAVQDCLLTIFHGDTVNGHKLVFKAAGPCLRISSKPSSLIFSIL
jgi:hypothetical protein